MNSKPLEYYEENKDKYELKPVYSGFGWFLFTFIGISAMPQRVEFIDKETNETAAVFTDHVTRKKYAGR